jgi:hypothetical protein
MKKMPNSNNGCIIIGICVPKVAVRLPDLCICKPIVSREIKKYENTLLFEPAKYIIKKAPAISHNPDL